MRNLLTAVACLSLCAAPRLSATALATVAPDPGFDAAKIKLVAEIDDFKKSSPSPRLDEIREAAHTADGPVRLTRARSDFAQLKKHSETASIGPVSAAVRADVERQASAVSEAKIASILSTAYMFRPVDGGIALMSGSSGVEGCMSCRSPMNDSFMIKAHASPEAAPAPIPAVESSYAVNDPRRYATVGAYYKTTYHASQYIIDMTIKEAIRANVDPLAALALVARESGFKTTARSNMGAMGLTQMLPSTAADLGIKNAEDLHNPLIALRAGLRYLKQQFVRVGGNLTDMLDAANPFNSAMWGRALAAYNAGFGNVHKYGGIPPFKETRGYVDFIMNAVAKAKHLLD